MENSNLLSEEEKKQLLLRRGFTELEIKSDLQDYCAGKTTWSIGTISPNSLLIYTISKGHEKEAYDKIYRYSVFLHDHRSELLTIRERIISGFRSEETDSSLDNSFNFREMRSKMLEYSRTGLEKLTFS